MKASELIEKLKQLVSEHGDLDCCAWSESSEFRRVSDVLPENIFCEHPMIFTIEVNDDSQ